MLGEAVVSNVIVGFEDSQPVIEGVELPFHICCDGVELDLRELGAGVEVDGAGAAKLCGIASVDERGALGFRDGTGLTVGLTGWCLRPRSRSGLLASPV